jgi:hypothetical protein
MQAVSTSAIKHIAIISEACFLIISSITYEHIGPLASIQ